MVLIQSFQLLPISLYGFVARILIMITCCWQRKATLLVEYQQRHKNNKLVDRRFGENDPSLSVEEKMLQRFALEKQVRKCRYVDALCMMNALHARGVHLHNMLLHV